MNEIKPGLSCTEPLKEKMQKNKKQSKIFCNVLRFNGLLKSKSKRKKPLVLKGLKYRTTKPRRLKGHVREAEVLDKLLSSLHRCSIRACHGHDVMS